MDKRRFLQSLGLGLGALTLTSGGPAFLDNAGAALASAPARRKAKALKKGDTLGFITPSGSLSSEESIQISREVFETLGFRIKEGASIRAQYGNLAGSDEQRIADIHAMFADPEVSAIVCLRGGTGGSRLLDRLDYKLIAQHPKVLLGYSDVTALIMALYTQCGLVSFHGAVGTSTWSRALGASFERQFFENQDQVFENPLDLSDTIVPYKDRISTLRGGIAEGILIGGNMTLITGLCGSPYLPSFQGAILFLEEVEEDMSRMERMFCQLKNAGILQQLAGFVFGHCTDCGPSKGYGSFTMDQLLADYILPLGIPAYRGARIGHIANQFILPVGVRVRMDAQQGTITMMEKALL